MMEEINDMPAKAQYFIGNTPDYTLPLGVPYLGMGSSYFAPLAFKYMGIDIYPELASEFYNYQQRNKKNTNAVLLSQSGRSTEVLWCAGLFEKYTAISNNEESPLCKTAAVDNIVALLAGEEKYSSSKTYINTLLSLFKGFGMDARNAVRLLVENMPAYDKAGYALAVEVYNLLKKERITGIYITGSGPNIATAMQAALIMSESTKICFTGLTMAQYDHGPKETAKDSIVLQIMAKGKSYERSKKLAQTVSDAGAYVFSVEEPGAAENESVVPNIVPFNFMAYYLSQKLAVQETFTVGGKVTEVNL